MFDPGEFDTSRPAAQPPLAIPARPDRTLSAVVLLAVLALSGMVALLPGSEEKAEGLFADGRYGDAIQVLVAVEHTRPLNAYESYMLFKLYMLTSQPDNAAALLAEQPALQTDHAYTLRQLSVLYRERRDFAGEASMLRQLYEINASETDFARLRLLYRLTNDVDSEASLLASAIAAGQATPAHRERLAYLRSAAGGNSPPTIWASNTGHVSGFASAPAFSSLPMPDRITPSTNSPE